MADPVPEMRGRCGGDRLKVQEMPIEEIREYDGNARKNEKAVEAVAKSIQAYGFKNPIIVDRNKVIIAGHTRLKAARAIGMEKVPVIKADDLTEEQVKAFRLADNKTAELSEWDFGKLELELDRIDYDSWLWKYFSDEETEMKTFDAEIDLSDFSDEEFEYECPCCGFRFNRTYIPVEMDAGRPAERAEERKDSFQLFFMRGGAAQWVISLPDIRYLEIARSILRSRPYTRRIITRNILSRWTSGSSTKGRIFRKNSWIWTFWTDRLLAAHFRWLDHGRKDGTRKRSFARGRRSRDLTICFLHSSKQRKNSARRCLWLRT